MFKKINKPVRFPDPTMSIEEFFGKISSQDLGVSIGRLKSVGGWSEARQRPEFDEYSLVLAGALYLTGEDGTVTIVRANEAVLAPRGESVQYSTPEPEGADYISICIPGFDMKMAHREGVD